MTCTTCRRFRLTTVTYQCCGCLQDEIQCSCLPLTDSGGADQRPDQPAPPATRPS